MLKVVLVYGSPACTHIFYPREHDGSFSFASVAVWNYLESTAAIAAFFVFFYARVKEGKGCS